MRLLRLAVAPLPPIHAIIFNHSLLPPRPTLLLMPCHLLSHSPRFSLSRTLTFPLPNALSRPSYSHLEIKQRFDSGKFGNLSVKCVSSFNPAHTLDWNEPLSVSEVVGTENEVSTEEEDEVDAGASIPVRAYFFSTRFGVH